MHLSMLEADLAGCDQNRVVLRQNSKLRGPGVSTAASEMALSWKSGRLLNLHQCIATVQLQMVSKHKE